MDKLKCISSSNYRVVSLDMESLFTIFPIKGALDCLGNIMIQASLPVTETEFTYSCIKQTAFVFNDVFYS